MKMKNNRLPYIDNAKAVLLTVAINLGVVFIFNWPHGITYHEVLWDSLICAIITTIINMWVVFSRLKKLGASGQMPVQVPVSRLMQRLPKNPFLLGAIYAAVFALLTIGINALIFKFFGFENITFAPWVVYKLIYATVLSIKIVEFCIFRYVQPDWASAQGGHREVEAGVIHVINPLPKISVFKEMFGSVTLNIAMNVILGALLGGTKIQPDGCVVIYPTTIEGIPVTGVVFGLIVGVLVTNGVVKAMKATILTSDPVILETATMDKRFIWMPKRLGALMCICALCVMIFSAVALPSVLHLFGKSALHFYQFSILITIYATLVSKPISYVLIKRCTQADYIRFVQKERS